MDKGKRPMDSGSSRSRREDFQRPMEDERSIKARNDKADMEAKERYGWNMFYKKMRKYTNRKNKKGKDWVPTQQEVEDEAERDPAVRKLWQEKYDRLIRTRGLTYEELIEGQNELSEECRALQKKIDEAEEKEWWTEWYKKD